MNPLPFSLDDEPLAQSLRQLQPSSTPLDPAVVFYRMGLEAGRQQPSSSTWPAAAALVLAATLSAVVIGPVGYRLGQASSGPSEPSAPEAEVLPLSPRGPMLAQREPAPSAEPITRETAEPAQAEVATVPAIAPSPAAEEPTSEQFADLRSRSWLPLQTAIANWLWGDALGRPNAEHEFMLAHRLTGGKDAADWLNENLHASPTGVVRAPDASSGTSPAPKRLVPRPKRREPLRASDWKEIVDSKRQFY